MLKERIRGYLARRLRVPEIPVALRALSRRGFEPHLIFDVGAHRGEFANLCWEIWGSRSEQPRVLCFEALHAAVEKLRELEQTRPVQVISGLIGADNLESVPLHEMGTASSVLSEHSAQHCPVSYHRMRTLETVITEYTHGQAPDLLKIDTQGYELDVLKGCGDALAEIRIILAELNFLDIYKNVPLMHEVVNWLGDRGWVPYDVCSLIRRPLDGVLWQADFLFIKASDPLRSDKRWQKSAE